MEVNFSSLAVLFPFFLLIISLVKVLSKPKQRCPPGPMKLPFIGHLHLFASHLAPHRVLHSLSLKHGSLMQLQLGEVTTLVVSSPKDAREFLKTHDETFASRPSLLSTEILLYGNTDIAFAPYGEYWRQLRKISTLELFSVKRVRSFRPIREEEYSNLCRQIASDAGSPVNLSERIKLTNYDVVTRASLGQKTKEQETFVSVVKEAIRVSSGFSVADVFPSIKLFQFFSGMRQRIERMHKISDRLLESIIDEHKAARRTAKGTTLNTSPEDLLDVLLKHQDAQSELPLSTDNIKAILMDMFSAGSETSMTTTEWAMSELLRHPSVMKKVQDEVRQVFNLKGYVDESNLHELTYLKLVIKETMRLHAPVPLLIPRESSKSCEINGYKIPAKTRVIVNAWTMGRDPEYWEEAERFKPERFIEKIVDYKGNNFEYIPFGSGKRICPGMTFGLANLELPLAMLLFHFNWILPDGMKPEELDMTEAFGATSGRTNPLYVVPLVHAPVPAK